jgi:HD-like signal output (HDOD) protein
MKAAQAPVSPTTVAALMQSIGDPTVSVVRVAEVVAGDAGLAARVLALANSAAYGLPRRITRVDQAVALVGTNMVQTLAIAGANHLLDSSSGLPHARRHAVEVACGTQLLARRAGLNTGDAFAAGLLHDLGEMLLWRDDPDGYATAHASWPDTETQLRAERAAYGTDHALAAREQLAAWHVPGVIVDAVGDHHRPDLHHRDLSTAVVLAELLADPDAGWSERFALFGVAEDDLPGMRAELREQTGEVTALLAS